MADTNSFQEQLFSALDAKTEWFDEQELPKTLNNYRLLHSCVKNLYEVLIKKSKIVPDPYKHDNKISDIVVPDNAPFSENERAMIIGTRFSNYETMLDFICTYFKFSVAHINIDRIRNLVALNASFLWHDFSPNSSQPNTRGLAELLFAARQESDALSASTINDSISKCAKSVSIINTTLKDLTDFQKEIYKGALRKDIFEHPGFDKAKAALSAQEEMQQIRKLYPAVMGKAPFYAALVEELVDEDHAVDREKKQQALLAKLKVAEHHTVKKVEKIDTKEMLMDAVRSLSAVAPQLGQIISKIQENHDTIENQHNTFWDKFIKIIRKSFNIAEPSVNYQVYIADPVTQTERSEKINYTTFIDDIYRRIRFYSSLAVRTGLGYKKIESSKQEAIIDFLNKQISECQELYTRLVALDDFFKKTQEEENSQHIKGMKMELTSIKNTIVKANQRRAEYISYIEEEAQMKKLGIKDEE